MADVLLAGFALMLVVEGILPFAAPAVWRATFKALTEMNDGQIRFAGLVSMVAGLAMLWFLT